MPDIGRSPGRSRKLGAICVDAFWQTISGGGA
jgi:hypothetical protein